MILSGCKSAFLKPKGKSFIIYFLRAGLGCSRSIHLHMYEVRTETMSFYNPLLQDKLSKTQNKLFTLRKRRIRGHLIIV